MTLKECTENLKMAYGMPNKKETKTMAIQLLNNLESFMRGLWEEICIGEVTYTTKEVYNMINKEVFGIEESVFINRPQFKTEDKGE